MSRAIDAASLYALVKDYPEVWADYLTFQDEGEASFWSAVIDDVVAIDDDEAEDWKGDTEIAGAVASLFSADHAELILEALFARSTGCGVFEGPNGVWFARHPAMDAQADGPTRLHALVAAEAARRSKA